MQFWDALKGVENPDNIQTAVRHVERNADLSVGQIDEVALMARDHHHALDTVANMVGQGWDWFNSAEDKVYTDPWKTTYEVEYYFLRRGSVPWRIELMNIKEGLSPLHHAVLDRISSTRRSLLPVVHFSYKVDNLGSMPLEARRLTDAQMIHGQTCSSTYGRFSYWHDAAHDVFVKPRVNVRDAK